MGGVVGSIGTMFGMGENNSQTTPQSANFGGNGISQADLNASKAAAQGGLSSQKDFMEQLAAQNGIQNQSNVFGQQQDLANILQQQSQGGGPNPALQMLRQQTGSNIANQAALMGSMRGANANVGLMGRNAAMQGAGIQQNAIGQASVMQAQQMLAAQQGLMNQQANMQNVAGNQVINQANATTGYNQMLQNIYGMQLGANNAMNSALASNQANLNNNNMSMAMRNANTTDQIYGGFMNSGMSAMSSMMSDKNLKTNIKPYDAGKFMDSLSQKFAKGGQVQPMEDHMQRVHAMFYGQKMADGGEVTEPEETDDVTEHSDITPEVSQPSVDAPTEDAVTVNDTGDATNFAPSASMDAGNISDGGGPNPGTPIDLKMGQSSSGGGGGGGSSGGGMAMMAMMSDERVKKSIEKTDPQGFMDALKAYSYDYKDQKHGKGKQVGVMAQDVEKGAPQAVKNTPEGKMIDGGKAVGPILAGLANLNERLKAFEGKKMSNGGTVNFSPTATIDSAPISEGGGPNAGTPINLHFLEGKKKEDEKKGGGGKGLMGGGAGDTNGGTSMGSGMMMAHDGTFVPGKAKVKGDSEKNDTVPAMLSPGEVVLPRTVMNAKDPAKAAYDFVSKLASKAPKNEADEFKEALKSSIKSRKG